MLCASLGMACSSKDSGEPDTRDSLSIEATTETHAAIGVATWGISPGKASAVIHGYDDHGGQLVSFEYHVAHDNVAAFDATLDIAEGHLALRVQAQDATHLHVLEDSFAGSAAAKAVLARIVADMRSQPAQTSETPPLTKTSLTFLDAPQGSIVQPGTTKLVDNCVPLLTTAAADGAETASNCSGGSNATACNQGMDKTTNSQGSSDECTLDCSGNATAIPVSDVTITEVSSASGADAQGRHAAAPR